MSTIYLISASATSAQDFFEKLKEDNPDIIIDIRLKNTSQLCGFTKKNDLSYLIHEILHKPYVHDTHFAPQESLLNAYLHHEISSDEYLQCYEETLNKDQLLSLFKKDYGAYKKIALISAQTPTRPSHAQVLARLLIDKEK